MAITPRDAIPKDWIQKLSKATGPLGLGYDIATTEKETSNPSGLTVLEQVGPLFVTRLVVRWKTKHGDVAKALLRVIFEDIARLQIRPRRMCVDATNERYYAEQIQKEFSKYCPVQLVVASENVPNVLEAGEPVSYKSYCGNLYVNSFEAGLMRLPNAKWLNDDHRLVKKDKGLFVADTSPDGGHADTFDSGKLARLALHGSGRAEASGAQVGSFGSSKALPQGLRNPLLKLAQQQSIKRSHA